MPAAVPAVFLFSHAAATAFYTLSLHDALPICERVVSRPLERLALEDEGIIIALRAADRPRRCLGAGSAGCQSDRKSTRLNSSYSQISYAVFCLKKKKNHQLYTISTNCSKYRQQ